MEDNASPEKWYILTRLRRAAHCWRHNLTTSEEFLPTPKMLDEAADEIEKLYNQSIPPLEEDDELPGELALQIAVEKGEWPHTMDAMIWADMFCKQFPDFDHGTALGWFANAIMAGYDTAIARQRQSDQSPL